MSIGGGIQGLHFVNTMSNAGLKTGAVQAKGIITGLAKDVSAIAPFAPLAAGGLIFGKLSAEAYDFSKDYENAMKEVETISFATQDNFEGISKAIIDMSALGPDSAIDLAKGFYQIVSAGYDGAKGLDILRTSSELATASLTSSFVAADTLTSILNAYGERAGTVTSISDKLFEVVKNGKITMEELGTNITNVTGLAAQAGLEINDLFAAYSTGTKTLKPEEFTTGMRGFLTAIIKPANDAIELASELGIEFNTTGLKAKGLSGFLQELMEKTNGNVDALATLFPNVRGLNGVLSIGAEEGSKFTTQLDNITTAAGNTKEALDTMLETDENQWKIFWNRWNRELKGLGDGIKGISTDIAKTLNQLFERNTDFIDPRAQEIVDQVNSQISTLENGEEKTQIIIDRILALRNQRISEYSKDIDYWQGKQPGKVQQGIEAFNGAIGLGEWSRSGQQAQGQLELYQNLFKVNQQAEEGLNSLLAEVRSSITTNTVNTPTEEDATVTKMKTIADAMQNIKDLKEDLGTGTIEQDVQLYIEIAEEQAFIDNVAKKIRERLTEVWGVGTKEILEGGEIAAKRTPDLTKEIKGQLQPMKQLTEEEQKQLEIEYAKIDAQRTQIENQEELAQAMQDSSEILGALSYAIGEVDSEAGQAVGRLADMARNASNMIASFSSQDYLSAAASGIGLIGNILGSVSTSRSDKLANALDNINESLERQATLLAAMNGEDWFEAAGKQAQRLREDIDELTETLLQYTLVPRDIAEQYRNAADQRGGEALADMYGIDTTGWSLDDILKALNGDYDFLATEKMYGDVNNLLTTILNLRSELDSISDDSVFDKLGFNTDDIAGTLSDGITQGLKLSEGGLGDFADSFKNQLNDAILQAVLGPQTDQQIQAYMEKMKAYADIEEDGSMFSEQEKNELEDLYRQLIENTQQRAEELGFMTETSPGGYSEAQGIQRSITEETGSIISGLGMSIRENQIRAHDTMMDQLAMAEEQLEVLQDIRDNTSYNHNLADIKQGIDDMNNTLKTGLAG